MSTPRRRLGAIRRPAGTAVAVLTLLLTTALPAPAAWRELMPLRGGTVSKIVSGPGGRVYAATPGGVFRSNDVGATWVAASGDLPAPPAASGFTWQCPMAVSPLDPDTVYVWTTLGLYKTENGGGHWRRLDGVSLAAGVWGWDLAIAPSNPNRLVFATSNEGVYRSDDGGEHWTASQDGLGSGRVTGVAFDPTNADGVYAALWHDGVYWSNDGGAHWSRLGSYGWPTVLAVSPSNPNVLYGAAEDSIVYRSANYGSTWTSLGRPPGSDLGYYFREFAIHPADPDVVYAAGGRGLARKVGAGGWQLVLTVPLDGVPAVALMASNPSYVLAGGTLDGVHRSSDGGDTWTTHAEGLTGVQVSGAAYCRSQPAVVYAAVNGLGYRKTTDGGSTWTALGSLENVWLFDVGVHPTNPDVFVGAATSAGGGDVAYHSSDGSTINVSALSSSAQDLSFNPLQPNRIHASKQSASYGGNYLSTDSGVSWSVPSATSDSLHSFDFHPTLPEVVFAAAFSSGGYPWGFDLFWRDTAGGAWQSARLEDTSEAMPFRVALDQDDPEILYVAASFMNENTAGIHKYRVSYSGSTITGVVREGGVGSTFNVGLTNTVVYRLIYDQPTHSLYAATPSGVFRSTDKAATWSLLPGLPYPPSPADLYVLPMDVSADGSRILVGTSGGLFEWTDGPALPRVTVSDVTVTEGNSGPSDAVFTVSLSIPGESPVTVDYATADVSASAGSDYTSATGRLTFEPGVMTQTVSVPVLGDTTPEANETFHLDLSSPTNATVGDAQAVGTILNDDGVAIAIADTSLAEGNAGSTSAGFTVRLLSASTDTVTVDYATADGTATAASDYTAVSGTLTFAAGVTTQTVLVSVLGDTTSEVRETFFVDLTNSVNATVTDGRGLGTINDDDATWASSGMLRAKRLRHTATLLLDGRVLVMSDGTADLYDPASGSWSPTGSPALSRNRHTATFLPSGKVLIAGGMTTAGASASGELYDPRSGAWAATGSLNGARADHTATLLPDGRVLVVGGTDGSSALASGELYDPAAGTWTVTGDLATARSEFTATLRADGKVLVAGGKSAGVAVAGAEVYDPLAGLWSGTGALGTARAGHQATLLADGRVLVVGPSTAAEIYDPVGGAWSPAGSLAFWRVGPSSLLLPTGEVLVLGGLQGSGQFAREVELYDPARGVWSRAGSLVTGRTNATATLLADGRVLVVGGHNVLGHTSELYDPSVGVWAQAGSLAAPRSGHSATLLADGRVLAVGGGLPSAELFDPAAGGWLATTSPSDARSGHTATLLGTGEVLVAGGGLATAKRFDPVLEQWTDAGAFVTPSAASDRSREQHTATLLQDGRLLVAGGRGPAGEYRTECEIYDPATGLWTATGSLATGRYGHTATLLSNGRVLVAGGWSAAGAQRSAELFDPVAGTWTIVATASYPRFGHVARWLRNGKVLVAGGVMAVGYAPVADVELYDPAQDTWSLTGPLSVGRDRPTATLLRNGKVLVAGGFDGTSWLSTLELYDPATGAWSVLGSPMEGRFQHTATLLLDGQILFAGGYNGTQGGELATSGLYTAMASPSGRRPAITALSGPIDYGAGSLAITGVGFRGDSEASGGGTQSSAVKYPLVEIRDIENDRSVPLVYDGRTNFDSDPMTLSVGSLPLLDRGVHVVSVTTEGVASPARAATVACSVAITTDLPPSQAVGIDSAVTFLVAAQGARSYQWYRNGVAIPGATASSYTTPPAVGADSGTTYQAEARGVCWTPGDTCSAGTGTRCALSATATLAVADSAAPTASVLSPSGGEYWLLSEAGSTANAQLVSWSMSDNVRICRVEADLVYSGDGGVNYDVVPAAVNLAPGGTATFGPGGTCTSDQEVTTTSLTYTIPTDFPSGITGSLYKIEVRVTDHASQTTTVGSPSPFYIVRSNPDSVRTLILKNTSRMQAVQGVAPSEAAALDLKLQELASHPRVQGLVVDLGGVSSLTGLYAAWDADPADADLANRILFGCHAPCTPDASGIHDVVRELSGIYSGLKYLIVVGDDRIVPLARIADRTTLLSESAYTSGPDLTATGTTVGQALAANQYLSDDPLAVLDAVTTADLGGSVYIPDLAVGRLVETPGEITTAIATFISQDGVLDLSTLDANNGHKVLVTGYDFLTDSAKQVRTRWKRALGAQGTPDDAIAPVDAALIGGFWGMDSVPERVDALRTHLSGNGAARYGVMSLSGHATHYEEGVPGANPFDIQGLSARDLYGPDQCASSGQDAVDLAGSVVYAVGCHGGLPVPGSCGADTDPDHTLDLPQTMLSRGVVSYVANTGYGWGLKYGIGYGERLQELLTEDLAKGGTVVMGDAVKRTKQRYLLETPRFDPYDQKSLMQWTFFGLPMYAVKTGITAGNRPAVSGLVSGRAPRSEERPGFEGVGKVSVEREVATAASASSLPGYLTQLNLHFDFTASGVYTKRNSTGDDSAVDPTLLNPGCSDPNGCYYTLNGLVERSSGASDLPLQPYFIYDSRLSGTSQHGVLWKGGTYDQETAWVPVFGELQSNGDYVSNHGSAPRTVMLRPIAPRVVPGLDPAQCRPSDLELNSLVVTTGEALKSQTTDPVYSTERKYREVELEVFYFNDTSNSTENCDREGPALGSGPYAGGAYHQANGSVLLWSVPATDVSGVWRVVVVVTDNTVDGSGRGTWVPVELTDNGSGTFSGSRAIGSTRATYVIQAVDRRGNVTWLDYVSTGFRPAVPGMAAAGDPASGVDLGVPQTVDVTLTPSAGPLVSTLMPWTGRTGIQVSIRGTGFTGATSVTFGGIQASYRVLSATSISATVPSGAVTGPVTVTTPLGIGRSPRPFTVTSGSGAALAINDVRIVEGNSGPKTASFRVWLTAPVTKTVTVGWATSGGTATAGVDFQTASGTLTFSPGSRSQSVRVQAIGDTQDEANETFYVTLSGPTNAALARTQGRATVIDDDP